MRTRLFTYFLFISLAGFAQVQNPILAIDLSRFGQTTLLWDLKALSASPAIAWVDSTSAVRSLLYESVPFDGKPTKVFAYYSNPDLLTGRQTSRTFPAVVLVHGGGGAAFRDWVEKWAAEGYAAIAMDLGGKGAAGHRFAGAGPDQSHVEKFRNIEQGNPRNVWTYHAVASVILAHSFLLRQPAVDPARTALTGISWGGYLTCLVASLDDRFKAAAPVYGCGFYDESDVFGKDISQLSARGRADWMRYFDPSVYLPYARPSLLFVNGNKDRFYNVIPYSKTYQLPQRAERNISYRPDMPHGHLQGWQPIEIKYFFDSVVNEGIPLPGVAPIEQAGNTVRARYRGVVGLRAARFFYSTDTTSTNETRQWQEVKARIDPESKTLTSEVPVADFAYGFFYVTDHREVSVSSPVYVRGTR
jgi:dienelactone hydrolase